MVFMENFYQNSLLTQANVFSVNDCGTDKIYETPVCRLQHSDLYCNRHVQQVKPTVQICYKN